MSKSFDEKGLEWTKVIMDALAEVMQNPGLHVEIEVGSLPSYLMIDSALGVLEEENEAAERISVRLCTLH